MKGKIAWNKGLKLPKQSEETKIKRSKSLLGHRVSIKTKILMSIKAKGRKFSDEHKDKLSKAKIKHGRYATR